MSEHEQTEEEKKQQKRDERKFNTLDIDKNKNIAAISYILFFLPFLAAPDSKYAKFHANQGFLLLMVCALGNIVLSILAKILLYWRTWWIYSIIATAWNIWIIVLMWKGIKTARDGKVRRLPVIGKIRINIIK